MFSSIAHLLMGNNFEHLQQQPQKFSLKILTCLWWHYLPSLAPLPKESKKDSMLSLSLIVTRYGTSIKTSQVWNDCFLPPSPIPFKSYSSNPYTIMCTLLQAFSPKPNYRNQATTLPKNLFSSSLNTYVILSIQTFWDNLNVYAPKKWSPITP
jgi:hypothetical protein